MQIGCTKKLLDCIGTIPAPVDTAIDPRLSWSANFITINRRHAVVVANDSSRYGFVLYGLKAKNFKSLDKLVIDGIGPDNVGSVGNAREVDIRRRRRKAWVTK